MTNKFVVTAALIFSLTSASYAGSIAPRDGWVVLETNKPFQQLVADVKAAAKSQGLGVVTQAGPTGTAAKRGITIPGNRVIGLFNNEFAVSILATSTAAMIEAPIRMYVTEEADGKATLSYKTPSHVFTPYIDEGGEVLIDLAKQLDHRFDAVAQQAAH